MGSEIMIPWFLTVFPLTFSPGPANVLFAATGTRFGFLRTLPLMLGVNTVFFLQSFLIGLGIGQLLLGQPVLLVAAKYTGVIYLFYLAYKLLHSSIQESKEVKPPSFWSGCILQVLNFKALMVPVLIFTQFLDPGGSQWRQSILMTTALIGLNLVCGSVWISGGDVIGRLLSSAWTVKLQGYVFGGLLGMVAIWMAFK